MFYMRRRRLGGEKKNSRDLVGDMVTGDDGEIISQSFILDVDVVSNAQFIFIYVKLCHHVNMKYYYN